MTNRTARVFLGCLVLSLSTRLANAQATPDPRPTASKPAAAAPAAATAPVSDRYRLGAYAEVDVGILIFLRQGTGIAGGAKFGPFRAGLSYASFLSNPSLGGVPEGFDLRVNYVIGINAAYFIGQDTDRGFYVQPMFHIKQQGVTNQDDGAHVDLNSLALGVELGYVWKIYDGLYVAPRVGALYYLNKPQPGNEPIVVGDKTYDNDRHKNWDTYYIPTLSVGYSWGK
ncbi:MAG TPA: hypothetical protein VGC79_35640 [Polyangiaceae bacterium]